MKLPVLHRYLRALHLRVLQGQGSGGRGRGKEKRVERGGRLVGGGAAVLKQI